jgi:glyoxylase-like metal-dependent hydrolase (beta-lactamase superfamily II)
MFTATKKPVALAVATMMALLSGVSNVSAQAQFAPETQGHLDAATRNALGDPDLMNHYRYYFCGYTDNPSFVNLVRSWVSIRQPLTQITDDTWYIGSKYVGQYILKSPSSFALIDTVNSTAEAQQYTLPALQSLGLSSTTPLAGIYLTHGHADHDGGAQFFRNTLNPPIYLGSADFTLQAPAGKTYNPILIDSTNLNPQPITIGDRTLTLLPTPGHTPGTTAAIVPVHDNGRQVNMLVIGGSNIPGDIPTSRQYLNSVERMYSFAKTYGAEGGMHPHAFFEGQLDNVMAQGLSKPSQFVVGSDKLLRGLAVWRECSTAFATNVDQTAIVPVWKASRTHFQPGSPSSGLLSAKVFNGWGPMANQPVTFTVAGGGTACTAQTNSLGVATCSPTGGPLKATDQVTASFAGTVNADYVDLASQATSRVNTLPVMKLGISPPILDLRTTGLVTVLIAAAGDLSQAQVTNVRALGVAAVATGPTSDGKGIWATFDLADFATLPAGYPAMITVTGNFVNAGTQDQFVASTAVTVIK